MRVKRLAQATTQCSDPILVPIALFACLSRQSLGTRNEGLVSRISGLHVSSRDVSMIVIGAAWRVLLPL